MAEAGKSFRVILDSLTPFSAARLRDAEERMAVGLDADLVVRRFDHSHRRLADVADTIRAGLDHVRREQEMIIQ